MEIVITVGIFLCVVLFLEGFYSVIRYYFRPEKTRVRRRVRELADGGYQQEHISILRKTILSNIPALNRILFKIPNVLATNRLVEQANAPYSLGFYILLSIFSLAVGYLAGMLLNLTLFSKVLLALSIGASPFLYLYVKKRNRMMKFERQLPDALEMISRALRAGHAFSAGLQMAADEFPDPMGTELGRTSEEINFGVSVPDALKLLAKRVDCPDLKFFVISVIIQRETGGNLAEIMESLAYLIRERFKLHGRVNVLAAEGKFSAVILIVLPFGIGLYLYLVQRNYLMPLFNDPLGRSMMISAAIMMVLGTLVMKRMVRLKV